MQFCSEEQEPQEKAVSSAEKKKCVHMHTYTSSHMCIHTRIHTMCECAYTHMLNTWPPKKFRMLLILLNTFYQKSQKNNDIRSNLSVMININGFRYPY